MPQMAQQQCTGGPEMTFLKEPFLLLSVYTMNLRLLRAQICTLFRWGKVREERGSPASAVCTWSCLS